MTAPGYEEFPLEDGTVHIDRHALDVGIELVDEADEDLTFVGRACSSDDVDRQKVLFAYALLDDVDMEAAVPEEATENTAKDILFACDKLRPPLLDILQQEDHEIQLRLIIGWFNREVAGMDADGTGLIEAFEEFADYMRDRAGVNVARTIYEHEEQLEGLGLDLNEKMAERWDPEPDGDVDSAEPPSA